MEITRENIERVAETLRKGKLIEAAGKMENVFEIAKQLIVEHPEINDPELLGELYEAQCAAKEAQEQNNDGQEIND